MVVQTPFTITKTQQEELVLGLKCLLPPEGEAYENLAKAQQLSQFLYPNYTNFGTDEDPIRVISQAPLLRLQVMNLLQSNTNSSFNNDSDAGTLYSSYGAGEQGMLGFCSDVTFNFNLDNDTGVFQKSDGTILTKLIDVSIGSFNPIHEHHLGWDKDDNFATGKLFPYGAQLEPKEGSSDAGKLFLKFNRQKMRLLEQRLLLQTLKLDTVVCLGMLEEKEMKEKKGQI